MTRDNSTLPGGPGGMIPPGGEVPERQSLSGPPEARLANQVLQAARQIAVHYGLWLAETAHQLGPSEACRLESKAGEAYLPLLTRRIERALDLPTEVETILAGLGAERLEKLLTALSVSWLAADGVWFRTVEDAHGMHDAKRVNDSCWSRLGYYEGLRAREELGLGPDGGLAAVKACLEARLVSRINRFDFVDETPEGFTLRTVDCRVQSARARQGLPPYPCASGGTVEYVAFAAGVDPAVKVACVSCPPDITRDDCACAWRFSVATPA